MLELSDKKLKLVGLKCEKKCPILTPKNEKIFKDFGHFTHQGARFFSKEIVMLLSKTKRNNQCQEIDIMQPSKASRVLTG